MKGKYKNLFLFAHQDDEFFFYPTIEADKRQESLFVFLTDGAFYGDDPEVRDRESKNVLVSLGVPIENIYFLRHDFQVNDTQLVKYLDQVFDRLFTLIKQERIENFYTLGWEGGHPDHDACFLLSLALAKLLKMNQMYIGSLYNGMERRKPFFNVMKPVNLEFPLYKQKISIRDAFRYLFLIKNYKTQLKTWIGLLPFVAYRLLIQRTVILQKANLHWKIKRPHMGPLYYEMRNWIDYESFLDSSRLFSESHQLV